MPDSIDGTPLARVPLVAHPSAPCPAVREVTASLALDGASLVLICRIAGDLNGLRIPAAGEDLDPLRLWAHTCAEIFVAPAGAEAYVEHNFSPCGRAARFAFAAYRERTDAAAFDGTVVVSRHDGAVEIEGRVPRGDLGAAEARLSLSAVIEDAQGELSLWAVRHPCQRPDFHHRGGLALTWSATPVPAIAVDEDIPLAQGATPRGDPR